MVEQKIALLSEFADRLIVMKEGSVLMDGTPSEVLEHSDRLLAEGINCPRSTTLMERLRRRGLYSGQVVRNVGEAVSAIEGVLA